MPYFHKIPIKIFENCGGNVKKGYKYFASQCSFFSCKYKKKLNKITKKNKVPFVPQKRFNKIPNK